MPLPVAHACHVILTRRGHGRAARHTPRQRGKASNRVGLRVCPDILVRVGTAVAWVSRRPMCAVPCRVCLREAVLHGCRRMVLPEFAWEERLGSSVKTLFRPSLTLSLASRADLLLPWYRSSFTLGMSCDWLCSWHSWEVRVVSACSSQEISHQELKLDLGLPL